MKVRDFLPKYFWLPVVTGSLFLGGESNLHMPSVLFRHSNHRRISSLFWRTGHLFKLLILLFIHSSKASNIENQRISRIWEQMKTHLKVTRIELPRNTPWAWNWEPTEGKISRLSKRTAAMTTSRSWKNTEDLNYLSSLSSLSLTSVSWYIHRSICLHIQQKVKILNVPDVPLYLLLQFFRCKMPYSCSAAALKGIHAEPLELRHFR